MIARYPESPVFYRHLKRSFPKIVSGKGVFLFDADGKDYLDGSSGAMVAALGHGVEEVADAIRAQMGRVAYVNGSYFTNEPVEALAEELAEVLPDPLRFSYFLASGSEANEAAVKLARQYFYDRGLPKKWKVITRTPSYHGNTLTALSLSSREHYRKIFGPLLTDFPRIIAPDTYRQEDGSDALTAEALEKEIVRQDPSTVAAFLVEPIVGSSSGAMVPPPKYFERVQQICKAHDVLFIADEVLCGMGRTGRWFAFQHFGVAPDIMTLGKGLNGGYAPLSAVVAQKSVVETIARSSGYFNHAQTYSHTPIICAAGLATVRYMKKHRLVDRASEMERPFFDRLRRLERFRVVGDIRGRGLLAGVEFVRDRGSKAPFPRAERFAERLIERALANGLILWPNTGHVDGTDGDLVMVAPPLSTTESEIDELVRRFEKSLEEIS